MLFVTARHRKPIRDQDFCQGGIRLSLQWQLTFVVQNSDDGNGKDGNPPAQSQDANGTCALLMHIFCCEYAT